MEATDDRYKCGRMRGEAGGYIGQIQEWQKEWGGRGYRGQIQKWQRERRGGGYREQIQVSQNERV